MGEVENESLNDPQTYAVIGAAMEVHRELGHGFLEAVYQDALSLEMTQRSIPFAREVQIAIHYKGDTLNTSYRADFIAYESVIIELKAQNQLAGHDQAQVINYLKSTGYHRALLLNFGGARLEYKRLVL